MVWRWVRLCKKLGGPGWGGGDKVGLPIVGCDCCKALPRALLLVAHYECASDLWRLKVKRLSASRRFEPAPLQGDWLSSLFQEVQILLPR